VNFKENRKTAVRSTVSPTSNGSIFTGGEELNPTMFIYQTQNPFTHTARTSVWGPVDELGRDCGYLNYCSPECISLDRMKTKVLPVTGYHRLHRMAELTEVILAPTLPKAFAGWGNIQVGEPHTA